MLVEIQNFILEYHLFGQNTKLVLAVSGGRDSMCLLHFLHQAHYSFVVAHCNFQLRGEESDADENFVKEECKRLGIKFFSKSFDTALQAKKEGKSIQEFARKIRYEWFEDLRKELGAELIVTAHHLNDNLETLLFNLVKGTGMKGLRSILPRQHNVVRPLLEISTKQIEVYSKEHQIAFREDSSNASDKYSRNKLRHHVIPLLEQINPQLNASMKEHFRRWRDLEDLHQVILQEWETKLFKWKGDDIFISIAQLKNLHFSKSLGYELFAKFGFNASDMDDLYSSLEQSEAKQFIAKDFRILKDRKFLIISSLDKLNQSAKYFIDAKLDKLQFGNKEILNFHVKPRDKQSSLEMNNSRVLIDADLLTYPLILRKWEAGDYFYPFGLTKAGGQKAKKKISKFLKDEKLSSFDKENTWVLCSESKIVWVVGMRLDERFKLSEKSQKVLSIKLV